MLCCQSVAMTGTARKMGNGTNVACCHHDSLLRFSTKAYFKSVLLVYLEIYLYVYWNSYRPKL